MYWAIPKLILTGKYGRAVLSVVLLFILTGGLSALVSLTILDRFTHLLFEKYVANPSLSHMPVSVRIFLAWMSGLRGSITIGGLAASIKLIKYFYEKQQQALMLQQEKAVAELQSLKAQLHPHFLFNTLNNIYSHAQDTAPVAADMLLGLSALLRYMLYYCNAPLVPLKQEVNMLMEYIELEKKRYGNQLEISVQLPNEFNNLVIAPLLILPFVENCFKHGTSNVLEKPWINIQLALKDELMQLKLINGKAENTISLTGGIGISNVRKRLALLYQQQYDLQIIEEDEVFIVNLSVQLKRAD
jgi:LytS/YehU family sensor histidine kinase